LTDPGEAAPGWNGLRRTAPAVLSVAAVAVFVAAVLFTWRRLFLGMDLQDESFYILVPWRWALGDKPFVHEQNLAQVAGLIEYPFIKLFAVIRGYDVTGLVLYTRHLYLLLMLVVAAVVWLAVRRLVRWQLALPVAAVFITFIFWQTPQLSYDTMGAAFLTLGTAFGLQVVLGGPTGRWAFAAGVAFGLAAVAYPTLLFVMPFFAVFLAFALGRRAVAMVAELAFVTPPDPEGPPTGKLAWRALSRAALGGLVVLVPVALVILSFGVRNLQRAWTYSMHVAQHGGQLGGASKAIDVVEGFWRFLWSRPYLLVAALLVYLVFRRWPRAGRALLALLPVALWFSGQRTLLNASGFVIVYVLLAPYLYAFIPPERRVVGVKLLYWVWVPAVLAGAMTAFTSAAGYLNAAVGLAPGMIASGAPPASAFLALAVLTAVLAVTIVFQFQFQQRGVPYADLTRRCDFGPWSGIALAPERYAELRLFASDLKVEARPDDKLLVFYGSCGYYLLWSGEVAANSYWIASTDDTAALPEATVDYYRRNRVVPTLVVHFLSTAGMTPGQLTAACGGLDYPPTLVRPQYALQRKPAAKTTGAVLAGFPRP